MSDWPLAPSARLSWAVSAIKRSSVSMHLRSSWSGSCLQPLRQVGKLPASGEPSRAAPASKPPGDSLRAPFDDAVGARSSTEPDRAIAVDAQVHRGRGPLRHPRGEIHGQRPCDAAREDVNAVTGVEVNQLQPDLADRQPGDRSSSDLAALPADDAE